MSVNLVFLPVIYDSGQTRQLSHGKLERTTTPFTKNTIHSLLILNIILPCQCSWENWSNNWEIFWESLDTDHFLNNTASFLIVLTLVALAWTTRAHFFFYILLHLSLHDTPVFLYMGSDTNIYLYHIPTVIL